MAPTVIDYFGSIPNMVASRYGDALIMHNILFVGPGSAKPFLEQLAGAIPDQAALVRSLYDIGSPSECACWEEVDILVAFAVPCTAQDMARAPRLKAVVIPSLGFEGVDVAEATARGISVANGHVTENFESVAEAAFLFMLMSLYQIRAVEDRLRQGVARAGPPTARMLKGKTIGIIGFGNIAGALVQRLAGWGADILLCTRTANATNQQNINHCDLATLLQRSDIVLPLLPLTSDTHYMLSKAQFMAMKKGAILINLSRGAVIDEAALSDPEVVAHLGGIALDVFEFEPLPMASPLRDHPKAILTGHEISHTQENLQALFRTAKANIFAAIDGRAMPTRLNSDAGDSSALH